MTTDPAYTSKIYSAHSIFDEQRELEGMLDKLDDRGFVLSVGAFAEDTLGSLLQAFMLDCEVAKTLVEDFNGPLGTFSARIKASFALGLITKEQFTDLDYLRRIRNEFAHTWRPIELGKSPIKDWVKNLSFSSISTTFPETPKQKMRSSMTALLIELRATIHKISAERKRLQLIGSRLMMSFFGTIDARIKQASEFVADTKAKHAAATGDRKKFYLHQLQIAEVQVAVLTVEAKGKQATETKTMLKDLFEYLNAATGRMKAAGH